MFIIIGLMLIVIGVANFQNNIGALLCLTGMVSILFQLVYNYVIVVEKLI